MFIFICLCFPTFISMSILTKKNKIEGVLKYIETYCCYNIFVNVIMLFFTSIIRKANEISMDNSLFTVSFGLKYLILASILACLLPAVVNYLQNNFKISFQLQKKKSKKGN